jgi:hypothetical protein
MAFKAPKGDLEKFHRPQLMGILSFLFPLLLLSHTQQTVEPSNFCEDEKGSC